MILMAKNKAIILEFNSDSPLVKTTYNVPVIKNHKHFQATESEMPVSIEWIRMIICCSFNLALYIFRKVWYTIDVKISSIYTPRQEEVI